MVVVNTVDNNSGVEVLDLDLPDAASTSHEEDEHDGGGSFWSWRLWVWDSINQMTIVMAMAMLCLFILLGFATATDSLSATAVKNNMSSTAAKAGKTKSPTSTKAGKATTVVQGCGESFTNQKVVLADNLDCGPRPSDQPLDLCAVRLTGPKAEINCDDYTLFQVATPQVGYTDGPFYNGICLFDGAVARNCNVQQFNRGLYVENGGEVRSSSLTFNYYGIDAYFAEDSTVIIEDT